MFHIKKMKKIFTLFKPYYFKHEVRRITDIPVKILMDNICDFEHVSFVHKKCFKYNTVIKRVGNVTILEYGVRHLPLISFLVTNYFLIHQKISINKVIHKSKKIGTRNWVTSEITIEEYEENGILKTLYKSSHESFLPFYLKPFNFFILKIANHWSDIVWHEDYEICARGFELEKMAF